MSKKNIDLNTVEDLAEKATKRVMEIKKSLIKFGIDKKVVQEYLKTDKFRDKITKETLNAFIMVEKIFATENHFHIMNGIEFSNKNKN